MSRTFLRRSGCNSCIRRLERDTPLNRPPSANDEIRATPANQSRDIKVPIEPLGIKRSGVLPLFISPWASLWKEIQEFLPSTISPWLTPYEPTVTESKKVGIAMCQKIRCCKVRKAVTVGHSLREGCRCKGLRSSQRRLMRPL